MLGTCPICDARVVLPENTEKSEIVSCSECKGRLHVVSISGQSAMFEEAPKIEEDWGE